MIGQNANKSSRKRAEFVVIGLGRFGTSLARTLVQNGHTVLGVDSDMNLVQRHSHEITQTIQLDSTDEQALKEIDITSFDTVVVAIGTHFEASLLTTVALKSLGVKHVLCKATNERQRDILLKVGADKVVLPEFEAGERLATMIIAPSVVSQMTLCPNVGISELVVPDSLVGRSLEEADLQARYGLSVVAIQRGTNVQTNLKRGIVFRQGDMLVVIGPTDAVHRLSSHV
ncbi:MAG: TrkA family potassium uptake protein [Armatimonadetes bacterium]|nr:TrkA family potassium uptake protein [Armatimonadota bacterium]